MDDYDLEQERLWDERDRNAKSYYRLQEIMNLAKDWADEGGHTIGEFIEEVNRRHNHAPEQKDKALQGVGEPI